MRSRSSRLCSAWPGRSAAAPARSGRQDSRFLVRNALVELGLVAPPRFAAQIDAQVHRDAVQPGIEVRLPMKRVEVAIHLEERFLADVAGLVGVADKAQGWRVHPSLIAIDQHPESRPVAAAGFARSAPPLPGVTGPARHARRGRPVVRLRLGWGPGLLQSMFAMSRLRPVCDC